jgi:AmpD protein
MEPVTAYNFDYESGLIDGIKFTLSPNHDHRPEESEIDTLVIHAISLPPSCFGGSHVEQFFANSLDCTAHPYFDEIKNLRVSAHFYIDREGDVTQFVPTHLRAWHAGISNYQGREAVNDFSIGIELEGCDDQCFERAQYQSLCRLTNCLTGAYPKLNEDNIIGHSDISSGRKTDPGPCFSWATFRKGLS